MQRITPFLWFDREAEEAMSFYTSVFRNSRIVSVNRYGEADRLWERLSEGGEKGRCGWLKDKFGVSWQIVPTVLGEMLADTDAGRSQRVMRAMLQMDKIDIEALRRAYEQR